MNTVSSSKKVKTFPAVVGWVFFGEMNPRVALWPVVYADDWTAAECVHSVWHCAPVQNIIFLLWILTITVEPACLTFTGRGMTADQRQSRTGRWRGRLFRFLICQCGQTVSSMTCLLVVQQHWGFSFWQTSISRHNVTQTGHGMTLPHRCTTLQRSARTICWCEWSLRPQCMNVWVNKAWVVEHFEQLLNAVHLSCNGEELNVEVRLCWTCIESQACLTPTVFSKLEMELFLWHTTFLYRDDFRD